MKQSILGTIAFAIICFCSTIKAQSNLYTLANAHSHNDDAQKIAFWLAYNEGFGSIEAGIFLAGDELLVASTEKELVNHRRLQDLYLAPLQSVIAKYNGHPYPNPSATLTLLINVKTSAIPTLDKLAAVLKGYPELTGNPAIRFVITGNRPPDSLFASYPSFIWFDGILSQQYTAGALSKIRMMSDNLQVYTQWNGKGVVPGKEWAKLQEAVEKAHALHQPVRLWDTPDFTNAWYQLMRLKVDYITTDHIAKLAAFLGGIGRTSYTSGGTAYASYHPTYRIDGINKPVKKLILLIGDGMGLAHLYAGYTANRGDLGIFHIRNIGLSKTSAYDSYVTDSAPGSTAIASGVKTNNRYVGVDHTGTALPLLPFFLARKQIKTGLITCGDIADATPADFYAHQPDRGNATAILHDLEKAPIDLLMGSGEESLDNVAILNEGAQAAITAPLLQELKYYYNVVSAVDSVTTKAKKGKSKWIVVDKQAGISLLQGRGNWLQRALNKTVQVLSAHQSGFFIMAEGAQIDYGSHANDLSYVATEVMDFDKTVSEALRFADQDGETLVIVTADHETGGLALLDGDYTKGYIGGQFASNDHTALPVPVFAYGPRSGLFRGVYENTALFGKILQAYGIQAR